MRVIEFLHKYFGFNKKERNGIILLSSIIVILILARVFVPSAKKEIAVDFKKVEALELAAEENENYSNKKDASTRSATTASANTSSKKESALFPFDPNTITAEEAQRLGLSEKTSKILINFRSKGGKFKNKEDLKKLYGLKEEMYTKLEPYILIQTEIKKPENTALPSDGKPAFTPYVKTKPAIVDINTADSLQLVYLPMIGPGFTKRILKYRNALGGFYKIEQLKEVYGMADSTYNAIKDKITISPGKIETINVNVAGLSELKSHPYITYNIANSIINYRSKHGLYKNLDDLKEVGTINDATLEKLKAYLSF